MSDKLTKLGHLEDLATRTDTRLDKLEETDSVSVLCVTQTLTDEQKAQARSNIDAANKVTGNEGDFVVIGSDGKLTSITILQAEEASF